MKNRTNDGIHNGKSIIGASMFDLIKRLCCKKIPSGNPVNMKRKIDTAWNNHPEITNLLSPPPDPISNFIDLESIFIDYMKSSDSGRFELWLGTSGTLSEQNKNNQIHLVKNCHTINKLDKIDVTYFSFNSLDRPTHYAGQFIYRGKVIHMTEEYEFDACFGKDRLFRKNVCLRDWFCCDELLVIQQVMQPLVLQKEAKQYIEEKYIMTYRFDQSDARYNITENELYFELEIDLETLRGTIKRARKFSKNM